jgi:hypothetical protein
MIGMMLDVFRVLLLGAGVVYLVIRVSRFVRSLVFAYRVSVQGGETSDHMNHPDFRQHVHRRDKAATRGLSSEALSTKELSEL